MEQYLVCVFFQILHEVNFQQKGYILAAISHQNSNLHEVRIELEEQCALVCYSKLSKNVGGVTGVNNHSTSL